MAGRKKRIGARALMPSSVATSTATLSAVTSARPSTATPSSLPRRSAAATSEAMITAIGCTTAGMCTQSNSWLWTW